MDHQFIEIQELDPNKKGIEYAIKSVTYLRQFWKEFVDPKKVQDNKAILFGLESMDYVRDEYKDEGFLKTCSFDNLKLMDSILNTLTEELKKDPPVAEVKAVDPAAMSDRNKDLGLLKNRKIIQGDLSALYKQIGIPGGYKFKNQQAKSNIEEFDEMQLDENDPEDIDFFKKFHRLFYEIAGQALINNVLNLARFDQDILSKILVDLLAVRRASFQIYVDKISGQIKPRYIYPETAKGIFGDSGDGMDDTARGWEHNITVAEFLQLVGNEFKFDSDWKKILGSINFSSKVKYTGFERRGVIYRCETDEDLALINNAHPAQTDAILSWNNAVGFRVPVGYIEWKTWEATSTALRRKMDNSLVDMVPYDYEIEVKNEVTEYFKEAHYQQQWYGAYFLSNGNTTQYVYNYSKVYYQQFEGANDEYSNGTLIFLREPGASAVEAVTSDIKMVHKVYYKMMFLIDKAKPQDEEYLWEELVQLNSLMKSEVSKTLGSSVKVDDFIGEILKYSKANTLKIRTYPQVEGKKFTQLHPTQGARNGVDPSTAVMQAIVEWGEQRLLRKILGNAMRLGGNPPSRESNKSEQNAVDASKNSTGYLYRLIQYTKERAATMTLLYAQDIINFEDSVPYKFIKNLLGETTFNGLTVLKDVAAHRFGIYVKDYNTELAKSDLRQAAFMSMQERLIEYDDYFMITQTEDFKEGARKYSLAKYKKNKLLRKQAVEDQERAMQLEQMRQQNIMGQLQFQRETMWGETDKRNQGLIAGKQIEAQSKLAVKDLVIQSEPAKQDAKSQSQQDLEYTKANIEQSKAYQ